MRRVRRARRLQVCGRRLGRHLPSGLTAAEPSPTASRSIMYSKQIDDHAIGDSFFLNAFRTDPAPRAWRANPDSSTVSSTLSPGPSPRSHGAGVRTAGPAPKRPLPLGGLHPGKGRSSRQLCPPSQGVGKAEGRAGEPHRPAGRARGGGRGPASWSREERLSPQDSAGPVRIRRLAAPRGRTPPGHPWLPARGAQTPASCFSRSASDVPGSPALGSEGARWGA